MSKKDIFSLGLAAAIACGNTGCIPNDIKNTADESSEAVPENKNPVKELAENIKNQTTSALHPNIKKSVEQGTVDPFFNWISIIKGADNPTKEYREDYKYGNFDNKLGRFLPFGNKTSQNVTVNGTIEVSGNDPLALTNNINKLIEENFSNAGYVSDTIKRDYISNTAASNTAKVHINGMNITATQSPGPKQYKLDNTSELKPHIAEKLAAEFEKDLESGLLNITQNGKSISLENEEYSVEVTSSVVPFTIEEIGKLEILATAIGTDIEGLLTGYYSDPLKIIQRIDAASPERNLSSQDFENIMQRLNSMQLKANIVIEGEVYNIGPDFFKNTILYTIIFLYLFRKPLVIGVKKFWGRKQKQKAPEGDTDIENI